MERAPSGGRGKPAQFIPIRFVFTNKLTKDDKTVWHQFLDLLAGVENPVPIHYGSYETIFLKRMCERFGSPTEDSAAARAINSSINLLSIIFARICFPSYTNGLKEVAGWLGFKWSERNLSGAQAIY